MNETAVSMHMRQKASKHSTAGVHCSDRTDGGPSLTSIAILPPSNIALCQTWRLYSWRGSTAKHSLVRNKSVTQIVALRTSDHHSVNAERR